MEPSTFSASPFLPIIGWSVVLLMVHIILQGWTATKELGIIWNAGSRDNGLKLKGKIAGRAERASANFRETYPAFIALALALVLKGEGSEWGLLGAWLWFAFRIAYLPLYLLGIPFVRSIAWIGSVIGMGMMLVSLIA